MVLFVISAQNRQACRNKMKMSGCLGLGLGEMGSMMDSGENTVKLTVVMAAQL
jgi:hypothetical protein